MGDCTCAQPSPTETGSCSQCKGFACDYAPPGRTRCSPTICDCFIESYPDAPFDLHPEAFVVVQPGEGIRADGPAEGVTE